MQLLNTHEAVTLERSKILRKISVDFHRTFYATIICKTAKSIKIIGAGQNCVRLRIAHTSRKRGTLQLTSKPNSIHRVVHEFSTNIGQRLFVQLSWMSRVLFLAKVARITNPFSEMLHALTLSYLWCLQLKTWVNVLLKCQHNAHVSVCNKL